MGFIFDLIGAVVGGVLTSDSRSEIKELDKELLALVDKMTDKELEECINDREMPNKVREKARKLLQQKGLI